MSDTGVVVFDVAAFRERYPEFATVPEAALQAYFTEATLYLQNDACSPVQNLAQRTILLWMLTAHIAKLNATINGEAPSGTVGRITSASQGSVSVGFDALSSTSQEEWWLNQTSYGAAYWAATGQFRRARYYPGRKPYLGVGPRRYGGF